MHYRLEKLNGIFYSLDSDSKALKLGDSLKTRLQAHNYNMLYQPMFSRFEINN